MYVRLLSTRLRCFHSSWPGRIAAGEAGEVSLPQYQFLKKGVRRPGALANVDAGIAVVLQK
jgi:hypothetical protein